MEMTTGGPIQEINFHVRALLYTNTILLELKICYLEICIKSIPNSFELKVTQSQKVFSLWLKSPKIGANCQINPLGISSLGG